MLSSLNTLRLWLPQIYQAMNDYQIEHNGGGVFCEMLETLQHKSNGTKLDENEICKVVSICIENKLLLICSFYFVLEFR